MEFLLIIVPNSFFQTSNSGHKWSLCRRHGALNPRLERVLSSFLHIVVQNFRNNDCWPFHFRFSNLVNPAKSSFCAEGMEHWILALRGFCPHFFTSLSKIFAIIDVDPSNIIIPSFWFRPKVTSVPKAWSTETTLWDGFVSISSHRCPKFSQPLMFTLPTSFFQASNSGHTWFLRRRHRALKPRFEKVLSAFPHIVVQNFGNNKS